jgi:hypothetical protein
MPRERLQGAGGATAAAQRLTCRQGRGGRLPLRRPLHRCRARRGRLPRCCCRRRGRRRRRWLRRRALLGRQLRLLDVVQDLLGQLQGGGGGASASGGGASASGGGGGVSVWARACEWAGRARWRRGRAASPVHTAILSLSPLSNAPSPAARPTCLSATRMSSISALYSLSSAAVVAMSAPSSGCRASPSMRRSSMSTGTTASTRCFFIMALTWRWGEVVGVGEVVVGGGGGVRWSRRGAGLADSLSSHHHRQHQQARPGRQAGSPAQPSPAASAPACPWRAPGPRRRRPGWRPRPRRRPRPACGPTPAAQ